ncbi:carbohydrate ABC transporter permease [Marinicrinis sediminis]|uniref:Carbohydrate ABC transporter permease n=1 Tax=Marinicrinis sediminis TaxID=1652465 RepID=A0ABW5RG07_9BACL
MGESRYSWSKLLLEIMAIALALVFLIPFYFVAVNSVKSFAEILMHTISWPKEFVFSNYAAAWEQIQFASAFRNSLLVTFFSNLGLIIISSMAAWKMARTKRKANQILFFIFVSAMVIPFQSLMIPLVKWGNTLGLIDTIYGLVIMYFGFGVSLNLFLYHGFVKSVPLEIEESAIVDGCNPMRLFWSIVFPLLKPITVTIIILNSLWIWNDFMLPLLILHSPEYLTIPLVISKLFDQFMNKWDLALPAMVMSVTPVILLYLVLQRYIIQGITAGALKG